MSAMIAMFAVYFVVLLIFVDYNFSLLKKQLDRLEQKMAALNDK